MNTIVAIPHHDYPADVRAVVESKLAPLERFGARIVSMQAILGRDHERHHVELVATVPHGGTLVADVRRGAFSEALDEAVHRMATQLRKVHDKVVDRRHARR